MRRWQGATREGWYSLVVEGYYSSTVRHAKKGGIRDTTSRIDTPPMRGGGGAVGSCPRVCMMSAPLALAMIVVVVSALPGQQRWRG